MWACKTGSDDVFRHPPIDLFNVHRLQRHHQMWGRVFHHGRSRLLFRGRGNLWPRLTCYRTWRGRHAETLDGTNNAAERAIGWCVEER